MSVYERENPAFLRTSVDSVFAQTLPPAEFVLVLDGPLTKELETEIAELEAQKLEIESQRQEIEE